jgi:hypothetical protein
MPDPVKAHTPAQYRRAALAVIAAIIVGNAFLLLASSWIGVDFGVLLFLALGVLFGLATFAKPWWFWNHGDAVLARTFFGSRGTEVAYYLFAAACLGFAALRAQELGDAKQRCRDALASAASAADTLSALQQTHTMTYALSSRASPARCSALLSHP